MSSAKMALIEESSGDTSFAHFLHRLVFLANLDQRSSLPLAALQWTVNVSLLSGVRALEELLPSRNTPVAQVDRGRHRALLSALYDANAALAEESLMVATSTQLKDTDAFNLPQALASLNMLREGHADVAACEMEEILPEEKTLPNWEVGMVLAARLSALEELMSWDQLHATWSHATDGCAVWSLRAEVGRCVMECQSSDTRCTPSSRVILVPPLASRHRVFHQLSAIGPPAGSSHGVGRFSVHQARGSFFAQRQAHCCNGFFGHGTTLSEDRMPENCGRSHAPLP